MHSRARFAALAAATFAAASVLPAQSPALRITRDGRPPVLMTADALRRLPIDSLRLGHAEWVVAALSTDGYVAVFSAGEIEPTLGPTRALIAYEREGAPLITDELPYQVIVPNDSHGTRSARMVTTVRIFDALEAPARR